MPRVEFEVPFVAGKQRPMWSNKIHRMYTPKETVAAERAIGYAYRARAKGQRARMGTEVTVQIRAHKRLPKSARHRPMPFFVKPDADNIAKLVCDALNGVAYKDDNQVTRIVVEKVERTDADDRTEVTVEWDEAL